MDNITRMVREEFSSLSDRKLARCASKIADESEEKASNPGYCIMMACQELILSGKRTPDDASKVLLEFSYTCEDKNLKLCMISASESLAGRRAKKSVIYINKYLLPTIDKIKGFLKLSISYFVAFWKRTVNCFLEILS